MDLAYNKKRNTIILCVAFCLFLILFAISLFIGKYKININNIFIDGIDRRVLINLRLPRGIIALFGGFALGIAGFVFQIIFKNNLATPDIIGISSGSSIGAIIGILFISNSFFSVTLSAFLGALITLFISILIMNFIKIKNKSNIVLIGISINALAQMIIMTLKMMADPERQLASIEYWIMGSINGVKLESIYILIPIVIISFLILFFLFRQLMILSLDDGEAYMLGVSVNKMRYIILILATLLTASVISLTGLISFISLLSSHISRLLIKRINKTAFVLSGLIGGILLVLSDILARIIYSSELPISIFTSLLGAPFLIFLLIRGNKHEM